MRDGDIDNILRAASGRAEVDPQLLGRIAKTLGDSAQRVRPLPSSGGIAGGLILICGAFSTAGAWLLGIEGLPRLGALQISLIFPALIMLIGVAGIMAADQMTPGGRRLLAPVWIAAGGSFALAALFGSVFDDYHISHFIPAGWTCLKAGVAISIPVMLAGWWVVRRGFFVTPVAAGLLIGALGGFAGIALLELHCANFEVFHIVAWHTAVLPVSAAAGAAAAWAIRVRRR